MLKDSLKVLIVNVIHGEEPTCPSEKSLYYTILKPTLFKHYEIKNLISELELYNKMYLFDNPVITIFKFGLATPYASFYAEGFVTLNCFLKHNLLEELKIYKI